MAQSGTYGDHITLQAASNLYNVEIKIASSLRHHARTIIQPQEYEPIARFCLGHFAEADGEHYVALDRYLRWIATSVSECDGGKETKILFSNDDTDDMLMMMTLLMSMIRSVTMTQLTLVLFSITMTQLITTRQLMAVICSITMMQLVAVICSITMMQLAPMI